MKADNPWYHARSRDYITPEDISAARRAGAVPVVLWHTVLDAIASKKCEDVSACAHAAVVGR